MDFSHKSFSHELTFAIKTAQQVGDYIAHRHKGSFSVEEKVAHLDFVTDVDTAAEDKLRKALTTEFPHYPFIGEEDNKTDEEIIAYLTSMSPGQRCWVVDPLDGTTNFVKGLPGYGVSIGLVDGGQPIAGVIYLPRSQEMFYAETGKGAWLGDQQIFVSKQDKLEHSFLSISFPPTDKELRETVLSQVNALVPKIFNVRGLGSTAQSLAYIAAGRFEGYWSIGAKPWDIAGGKIIIEEAGGAVTNFEGAPYTFATRNVYCSNQHIDAVLQPYLSLK